MAEGLALDTIFYALLGGVLPAVLWLIFWRREDIECPEPRWLIVLAFISGMLIVPLVLPFQKIAVEFLPAGLPVIFSWAAIEEIFKFGIAALVVLWQKDVNEPIDPIIYMLTVALGFSALENAFFLLNPIAEGNLVDSFVTGNLRFLGATLLHVLASSMVGVALAFAFYRPKGFRIVYGTVGLLLAIFIHTAFNVLILGETGRDALSAFLFVWGGIVVLFFLFEVAKWIRHKRSPQQKKLTCDV
jgi:RsiW-degrading membrane proteinase PrsW (M82 family)